MTRPRPYIQVAVRCIVARRQYVAAHGENAMLKSIEYRRRPTERLELMLGFLFDDKPYHLDHNPALILREFDPFTKKYTPAANDPDHLIYRSAEDHHIKTNVRGDGALRSDTSERMHRRRLDENRGLRPRKPKAKIRSRGFPKIKRKMR